MNIFEMMKEKEHEQLVYCHDRASGLKAIIAIHNTTLGPALGGCRMWNYNSEEEAIKDVLRLARGMTYKSSVAGLNLGGGKAVIIGDSKSMKKEALFRAFGRFVQSLGGRYITAEDVGTTVRDMEWVRTETDYVTGISRALGGSGDPSPFTALGVFHGLRAACLKVYGSDSLKGKTVLVQGLGQVGFYLVGHLLNAQSNVIASDIDEERIRYSKSHYEELKTVLPSEIFDVPADIFSPCALGGTVNSHTIPRLSCKIIAGSANNILENEEIHPKMLEERGILYVPDYVINAGGLINVYNELEGYRRKRAIEQVQGIFDIVWQILNVAEMEKISTVKAANALAERRISEIADLKKSSIGMSLHHRNRR